MKKTKDRFSGHSEIYQKYRPIYPRGLYECILSHTQGRESCWDCATGNGQVAMEMASYFKEVRATDISGNQLRLAPLLPNVTYGIQRAENTNFDDDLFDLITVAQALHWFDIPAFLEEVKRVSRPGGTLAVWGYGLLRLGPPLDEIISHFYTEVVGPYWDGERHHIDSSYASIGLPLTEQEDLGTFRIIRHLEQNTLKGYLTSWSSVQNYMKQHSQDPVDDLMAELKPHWPDGDTKEAVFPIFGTVGTIIK